MLSLFETDVKRWMVCQLDALDAEEYGERLARAAINYFDLYGCESAQEDVIVWAAEIVKEHLSCQG